MLNTRWMQMLLLVLVTIVVGWCPQLSQATCSPGTTETFVLQTNVLLTAEPYEKLVDKSLEECLTTCQRSHQCRSLVMRRNDVTSSICFLYTLLATKDNRRRSEDPRTGLYYLEKRCLKGACNRLFTFEVVANSSLESYGFDVLQNVSQSHCLESCFLWTKFVCRSAEYEADAGVCRLNRYDRYSRSINFATVNRSVLYFDNNCIGQQAFEGPTAEVILLGNAKHPYVISEYTGTTVGECGQLCLQNTKFPCRSFLYGKLRGTTYCALSHQNRVGLLKRTNNFSPSDNISYYEIAPNIKGCDPGDIHFELTTGALLQERPFKTKTGISQKKCLQECRTESKCHAVSIDYVRNECSLYEVEAREVLAENLRLNDTFNFFEKMCLPTNRACNKQWAFERVRGRNLVSPSLRRALPAFTKEECLASCLELKDYECKSVQYDSKHNECYLSGYNRFSMSEKSLKFHRASLDLDYYENNCADEPRGFCNTKVHRQTSLGNAEETVAVANAGECRKACFQQSDFNCRAYTYNSATGQCSLSHHTTTTIPFGVITKDDHGETHEITSCYNVTVACEHHVMRVNVRTSTVFDGKIYVRHKADTCYADVSKNTNFTFPIPLGPECGTQSEKEGKFSNVIVIQNNGLVLTATDKAVGVHCTYELGNKTEFTILTVSNVSSSETSRGRASPPQLTMRILDLKGNDKTSVKLGEPLRIQVAVDDKSAYGIFVRNMVAIDGTGTSNLTLIDNKGCPAEAKMIREMRQIDGQSRALESVMEAFTFTGSNVLRIETDVETCLDSCNPVLCHVPSGRSDDQYMAVESLGRRRKRSGSTSDVQVFKLSRTLAVHSEMFGVGTRGAAGHRRLQSDGQGDTEGNDGDYEFVRETLEDGDTGSFCLDSMILTIAGSAFLILQIILAAACIMTKYYRGQKKEHTRKVSPFYNGKRISTTTGPHHHHHHQPCSPTQKVSLESLA